MRSCPPDDTVTALVDSGASLAIACLRCHHRTLFGTRLIGAYELCYRAVDRLPLFCRCGSNALDKFVIAGEDEARAFLS
ncbi:MAG: hypothetical protein WCP68_09725 [Enhydrobacter sp.]